MRVLILIGLAATAAMMAHSHFKQPVVKPKEEISFKKLDPQYCITYGNKDAPLKIVEFFSFQCPYCVRLFREEFQEIKASLIDTGKASFQFHPVPQDLATVQALICFESLNEREKRLFLEALLEEAVPDDPELMGKLMMAAMNVLKKPVPQLDDKNFIQEHPLVETIFVFLKQEKILAVPSVEVNGSLFPDEIPTYQFVSKFFQG